MTYFEEYDAFAFMQTSIIDEVMKDLVYGESEKQGDFLQDSTNANINDAYGNEIFKDFETDMDLSFSTERMNDVLPHKYSF